MKELTRREEIERSLITKYKDTIYSKVIKANKKYNLIEKNDRIMVCISGGKDSFCLAKCIQELALHGKVKFEAKYVVMDPGYNSYNLNYIIDNAKLMGIPIEIFNTDIFDVVNNNCGKSPCYLCARMRRGHLYNKAKELGCNKIALGHHFNDVIETTMLSMLYCGEIKTMLPKLHSTNFDGIDLIRPLCLVREDDIKAWRDNNDLTFINCACKFTEGCSIVNDGTSKRRVVKDLIKEMKKTNNNVEHNIYKALENINLNCVIGGNENGKEFSFLDKY